MLLLTTFPLSVCLRKTQRREKSCGSGCGLFHSDADSRPPREAFSPAFLRELSPTWLGSGSRGVENLAGPEGSKSPDRAEYAVSAARPLISAGPDRSLTATATLLCRCRVGLCALSYEEEVCLKCRQIWG
ncbi:hypothetical protein AAFF_G00049660 [Aldrovandia affinis]|uniref:Uncharacterized protein n=1 Tax=Aldrovandia affinis TaxID=143900 RepID=A0AAD7S3R1_9TELE|nr:hypothetical protein AAFF_G00049660 [Aldrovandia affinis]